ncbi:MAG: phosphatase PAP2 family protein [Prevotella sp.]|nr:phosphatase PAP2 family protein [Prevotella sp.]
MVKFLKQLFVLEKKPTRGLLAVEWVVMIYLVFTLLIAFFMYTKLQNPNAMIWGRVRIVAITAALWLVYRIVPCRFTRLVRIAVQMGLLAWWYPDTYEINRMLPNLDHVFAQWEQSWFGCQPALLFSQALPGAFFSELFDMGYAAYYPMIALVVAYFFGFRYQEFERAAFIVMGSFFLYYLIFIFLPVAGPTFYYKAVGLKKIAAGIFPPMHDYFNYHQDCLPSPGYVDGLFYQLVEDAKSAGERPTAAFPSSHVGISTVIMWLIWHARNRRLLLVLLPFYVFLCCATVYIQAHYLVDAIFGFITGTLFFFVFLYASRRMKRPK